MCVSTAISTLAIANNIIISYLHKKIKSHKHYFAKVLDKSEIISYSKYILRILVCIYFLY